MEVTKEEFVESYEDYIELLIIQQAKMVIEINNLRMALTKHDKEMIKYHLKYYCEEGIYSYLKGMEKKIGF